MAIKIIGVVGYSDNKCKSEFARNLVEIGILEAAKALGCTNLNELHEFAICSGLTNLGIPALAYQFAKARSLYTIGIACNKAIDFGCYPVDERVLVGDEWGAESETFLATIDALVRVGGGPQSEQETLQWQTSGRGPYIYLPLNRDGS